MDCVLFIFSCSIAEAIRFEFDVSSGDALDEDGASIVHAATAVQEPMKPRLLHSILVGIDLDKGKSS